VKSYYPFGLNHYLGISVSVPVSAFSPSATYKNYKYNGKELQETGMYAMDWRNYMPDIGRFVGMDMLSELSPNITTYRFGFNNPIFFSDPTGLSETGSQRWSDWITDGKGNYKWDPNVTSPDNTPEGWKYVGKTGSYRIDGGTVNLLDGGEKETIINPVSVNAKFKDPVFWASTGFAEYGLYDGYKSRSFTRNEIWWKTNTRGYSNVLQKKWYNPGAKYWGGRQTIKATKLSKTLSWAALATTGVTVINNQSVKTSDIINASMGTLAIVAPGIGTTISGVYFVTDLAVMGISYIRTGEATGIGDYIDQTVEKETGNEGGNLYQWGEGHLIY